KISNLCGERDRQGPILARDQKVPSAVKATIKFVARGSPPAGKLVDFALHAVLQLRQRLGELKEPVFQAQVTQSPGLQSRPEVRESLRDRAALWIEPLGEMDRWRAHIDLVELPGDCR